ncbi:unnamed protein product [Paramecium octaurelia]|uniref:Uncharacterized protein n=1 Tax=Paramecium octaurelia TaxID=43137 RepID=A0A8S1TC72_PAROT|nr:unnamed protein product [Paramecium octaurelia]
MNFEKKKDQFSSDKIENNIRQAFNFLFGQGAYEIGFFQSTWKQSIEVKGKDYYDAVISAIMVQVVRIADEGSDQPATQYIDLIILLIDGLIFNLYSKNKSSDRAKIHQSLYQTSQQSQLAQQSGKIMESIGNYVPLDVKVFVKALERMATSFEFFESLDIMMNYNDADQNKLQLSHFVNTLEYILEKEQVSDQVLDDYIANKGRISKYIIERQSMAERDEIEEVNKLIFSNKLLIIKKLLFVKNDTINVKEVHFTLGRIYFAAYSKKRTNYKRSQFSQLKFQGEDMIHNIFKQYINSQTKRDMLFKDQDDSDPYFQFLLNYMQLLYSPVYFEFQQLLDDLLLPNHKMAPPKFFATVQPIVETQFISFFASLPPDLLNLLAQFNQTIQDAPHFTDNLQATFPVKNLFISKFLLNPNLKEQFINQDYNMDHFITIANLFKDLFFNNTNRSYSNLPQFQEMSQKLKNILETYITSYDNDVSIDIYSYFITDPLLQNDYNFLYNYYHNNIKVLPSDIKDIHMDKFNSYMPKRVYVKANEKGEDQQQKQDQKDKENQQDQQDLINAEIADDDRSEKSKGKQYVGPDYQEDEFQGVEKVEKATQTEVQEDEDLKNAEKFQPNFNEKSVISDQSVTPLEQEEKEKIPQKKQVTIPQYNEYYDIDVRQQEEKIQEDTHKYLEEIQQLKIQIDELKDQHSDAMAQVEFDHNQQIKKMEFELNQSKLRNEMLENEVKLKDLEIEQRHDQIEKLFDEKVNLGYQLQKALDEKELLQKHFEDQNRDYKEQTKQFELKDLMSEFDSYQAQINKRKNELMKVAIDHEIQQKKHYRKLNI